MSPVRDPRFSTLPMTYACYVILPISCYKLFIGKGRIAMANSRYSFYYTSNTFPPRCCFESRPFCMRRQRVHALQCGTHIQESFLISKPISSKDTQTWKCCPRAIAGCTKHHSSNSTAALEQTPTFCSASPFHQSRFISSGRTASRRPCCPGLNTYRF